MHYIGIKQASRTSKKIISNDARNFILFISDGPLRRQLIFAHAAYEVRLDKKISLGYLNSFHLMASECCRYSNS